MINTETSPRPTSLALRTLGWIGLWLCSALFFPVLVVWTDSFGPQRSLRLMQPGTSLFWRGVGINVLFASMMTFSRWQSNRKPTKRRTPPKLKTTKDRWRPLGAGGLLLGIVVLQMLASNPGAAVKWGGVAGGAAALALLFVLIVRCANLTLPPRISEEVEPETTLPPPNLPALPLDVRPPKNSYRAEVSAREVVYRQPLSTRVLLGVFGLILGTAAIGSEGFALVGLGVPLWGIHPNQHNPAMAVMMGGSGVLVGCIALSTLLMTGPCELRVTPSENSYVYRICTPVCWVFLKFVTDDNNQNLLGLPWKTVKYQGRISDITGVQRSEVTNKSTTSYSLFLCWHDSTRPPMRVGFSTDEAKARALQAQAAEDLGVPLLPDEVV